MQWEYEILTFSSSSATVDKITSELDKAGGDGWELVAVRPVVTSVGSEWNWLAIMKRPIGWEIK